MPGFSKAAINQNINSNQQLHCTAFSQPGVEDKDTALCDHFFQLYQSPFRNSSQSAQTCMPLSLSLSLPPNSQPPQA